MSKSRVIVALFVDKYACSIMGSTRRSRLSKDLMLISTLTLFPRARSKKNETEANPARSCNDLATNQLREHDASEGNRKYRFSRYAG